MTVIPLANFASDTLHALLADIVTRDGTDYGDTELSQDEKIGQLLLNLEQKLAYIAFDAISESCVIISPEEAQAARLLDHAE